MICLIGCYYWNGANCVRCYVEEDEDSRIVLTNDYGEKMKVAGSLQETVDFLSRLVNEEFA